MKLSDLIPQLFELFSDLGMEKETADAVSLTLYWAIIDMTLGQMLHGQQKAISRSYIKENQYDKLNKFLETLNLDQDLLSKKLLENLNVMLGQYFDDILVEIPEDQIPNLAERLYKYFEKVGIAKPLIDPSAIPTTLEGFAKQG